MNRRLMAAVAVIAALATGAVTSRAEASPPPGPGSLTEHLFPATPNTPARYYWVYVPPGPPGAHRSLLVFLHGCESTAQWAIAATHFDQIGAADDVVVVYPQETVPASLSAPFTDGNGAGCWNWFLPEDQSRDSGEPGTIAGITRYVAAEDGVNPNRLYVDGFSAGADMAVVLGATYPDLYAAIGAVGGCPYRTCSDTTGALTHQAMGQHARVVPMFVENGTADEVNNMGLATNLVSSWLGADDFADDGRPDGSVSRTPASSTTFVPSGTPQPGTGGSCSLGCPGDVVGFRGSYPYTVLHYEGKAGCDILDFWVIHGMEHQYPDQPANQSGDETLGPDISAAAWAFFAQHPMSQTCS